MVTTAVLTEMAARWKAANPEYRGEVKPARGLLDTAKFMLGRTSDSFGHPVKPWKPTAGLTARFKGALVLGRGMFAYSDDTLYAVPCDGAVTDLGAARGALAAFVRRGDTHTGWAGSGVNWTVDAFEAVAGGAVALLRVRHSLSE